MSRIVGIGAALLDFLARSSTFPKEDTKMMASSMLFQGGGPCSTALVAVRKLGLSSSYIGTVGDDLSGRHILAEFIRYGVDTSALHVVEGKTSSTAFVLCNAESGSRTCVWAKGSLAPMAWKDEMKSQLDEADVLHLDGNHLEAAVHSARYMHSLGKKVSLDAGGLYPNIEQLLPYVDILIPSEEFALGITGKPSVEEAALALQNQYAPSVLVVTRGKEGGIYFDADSMSFQAYPAFCVDTVDTNGAGDVFHGAFLTGMLKGLSTADSCKFASAVSALKCTVFGAREGIPSLEKALFFLQENGVSLAL
ncbi:MAG: PfkB family carbohydrate kinase [Sphaerochaeta associata]|uniref:carbohydrate kinase family protein n=1 Tax=Sphaerochaeta associata TaxID=1129264 RepID=UPI002B21A5D3|nr:PfkB family carbohydrate kinase [Sphaerochaeta associata]MEA5107952.1 PfkB family carbohydrate kinase [Sphaerochaeta associata]